MESNKKKLTPLDFLAHIINEKEAKNNGYSYPTRWLALKPELKEEYIEIAQKIFDDWVKDELNMEKERSKKS